MWPSEKETEKDTEREAKKIIICKIIAQWGNPLTVQRSSVRSMEQSLKRLSIRIAAYRNWMKLSIIWFECNFSQWPNDKQVRDYGNLPGQPSQLAPTKPDKPVGACIWPSPRAAITSWSWLEQPFTWSAGFCSQSWLIKNQDRVGIISRSDRSKGGERERTLNGLPIMQLFLQHELREWSWLIFAELQIIISTFFSPLLNWLASFPSS